MLLPIQWFQVCIDVVRYGNPGKLIRYLLGSITVAIQSISPSHVPPPSWRRIAQVYETDLIVPEPTTGTGIWNQVLYLMRSTNIYGPGILELIQIAADYQLRHKIPVS